MQTFDLDGELPSLMTTEEHNQLIREKLHIINWDFTFELLFELLNLI